MAIGKYQHNKDICLKNLGNGMKGKKHTKEWKNLMSKKMKNRIISKEQKKKISQTYKEKGLTPPIKFWFKKGHNPWNKGIKMSLNQRKQISATKRGILIEEIGNIIKIKKYSIEFYKKRDFIKKRDNFVCRLCGKKELLDIHHIDYNKNNNKLNNLISLCHSCHSKTNKNRSIWLNKFKEVTENSYG